MTITVAFQGGSDELRALVVRSARHWTDVEVDGKRPNVQFDFGSAPHFRDWSVTDLDYAATVRVAFDTPLRDLQGRWSAVGRDSKNPALGFGTNQPSMMLYYFDRRLPYDADAAITHEFGHTLGFEHEHQNPKVPTAGCDFRWTTDNDYVETHQQGKSTLPLTEDVQGRKPSVLRWFGGPFNFWPEPMVIRNLKQLPDQRAYETGTTFDRASIMKYFFPAILFHSGIASPCYSDSENMVLSAGDKAGILNAYPQSPTAAAGQAAQRATVVQRANNPKLAESLRSDLKARVDDFHDIANGHTKIQVLVP